ncbi:7-carboxy-7-deazaguanine synthase [Methanosarcinales archaeon]|nr:7-carboxy-7-deazaguanine synthase QueE [Candidatus Methanoperedens sp.]CAG0966522.1 7-carboxy-7-deazaguanine synthase [Methanosarcinales archaeon]
MPAYINEIFNSIQGEGPYAGMRQVFVRFEKCQLHCSYCDTPQTREISGSCKIETHAGSGEFIFAQTPLYRQEVTDFIRKLWTSSTKHVSLTGGEPLLHADFIKTLDMEYPLYLETNSGFPEKAQELKDIIAIASCDIKLPEHDCTDHYSQLLKNELETISILNETAKTFVKVIIMPETTKQSLSFAIKGVKSIDDNIPFILQPVTSDKKVPSSLLFELMDFAGEKLKDVRAIGQTHKMMNLL